jgi:hypothetical protein
MQTYRAYNFSVQMDAAAAPLTLTFMRVTGLAFKAP